MHTDCATLPGTSHLRQARSSQDFTLHGTGPGGLHWALVADGCSTGGSTDLGARIWGLAARKVLQETESVFSMPAGELQHRIVSAAEPTLDTLDFSDGFATLALVLGQGSSIRVLIWGDGEALCVDRNARVLWQSLSYSFNAPLYLNYLRHPVAAAQWRAQTNGQHKTVCTCLLDCASSTKEPDCQTQSQAFEDITGNASAWEWRFEVGSGEHATSQDAAYVLVSTDGVQSCSRAAALVVQEVCAIRSSVGEFLKRRMGKLWKTWQERGQLPSDDLSVAGICLLEEL